MTGAVTEASAKGDAAFGFSDDALARGYSPHQVLPLLDRTGATVYRMDIPWDYAEPSPGVWHWDSFDRAYRALRDGGVRPLAVARSAPRWAQDDKSISCGLGTLPENCQGPPAPDHVGDWEEFVRRLAERYPGLAGVEVFNEPNYAINNWRPQADPVRYTQVLEAAHAAVKSVHAGMPVVFGGLLNVDDGANPRNMSAQRFLRESYAAGARGAMDAIAIHPYGYLDPRRPADPESPYHRMLADMRAVRRQAGDELTPFWITETGYPTGPAWLHGVTPEVQADRLAETIRLALSEPDVSAVLLHSLIDRGDDPNSVEDDFGVVRADLSPKPALSAIAAITGAPRLGLSTRRRYRARARWRPALGVTLSEPARVAFRLERRSGRSRRYRRLRRFTRSLGTGSSKVGLWLRRGYRVRRLPRGSYRVSARATDRTGELSPVKTVRLRVVR